MANLLTPSDIGRALIVVSLLLLIVAYIAIALRFWCLHKLKRKTLAHDILAVSALVCASGLVVMWIIDVYHGGLGQHGIEYATTGNPAEKLKLFGKIQVAMQPIWAASLTFVRLSILNLYTHIFKPHDRFRKGCWFVMMWAVLWFIGDQIAAFMVCRPVAFNWDQTIPGGRCGNAEAAYIAIHTANIIIDVSIAVLPAPILWSLQLKPFKKTGIICMFSLGALICAISIARLVLYEKVNLADPDFTYISGTLYLFTVMEPLLAITLACLPLLTPVGNSIVNSPAISWIKSITSSIGSSSKGGSKLSTDKFPLHPNTSNYHKMDGGKGIVVNFEHSQSYEMNNLHSRQV